MAFERAKQIIAKAQDLLSKLEHHQDDLDELQKAQVVQSLIKAKVTIVKELQIVTVSKEQKEEHHHLFEQVKELEQKIQHQAASVNFPKVQVALDHLSEGVNELLNRKKSGEKVVEE